MAPESQPDPLKIRVGYEIALDLAVPTPMLLLLNLHPCRVPSLLKPDRVATDPPAEVEEFLDSFGNRCSRLFAPSGRFRLSCDTVVRDSGRPDPVRPEARQLPVAELPVAVLPFLRGSRYCETDRMMEASWDLFGSTPEGWPRVQAVCDWVHGHVCFGYEHARPTMSAWDVFTAGTGVCRDFMHLAITFCRCLNIPARYASGYLGDIGIPPQPLPMDFSAWMEVFLEGGWHTFDPRFNAPRIGRVLMARGRDAADAALTTCFGPNNLAGFTVWAEEVEGEWV